VRWPAAALAAAALLAVAGCGGQSEEEKARAALQDYVKAFVNGDGKRACELMTDDTRTVFVDRVAPITKTGDCARSAKTLRTMAGDATADALRGTKISDLQIKGDNATATLEARGSRTHTRLEKHHGQWQIASGPGLSPPG
jgi:ketosteroid isomerase-like protein